MTRIKEFLTFERRSERKKPSDLIKDNRFDAYEDKKESEFLVNLEQIRVDRAAKLKKIAMSKEAEEFYAETLAQIEGYLKLKKKVMPFVALNDESFDQSLLCDQVKFNYEYNHWGLLFINSELPLNTVVLNQLYQVVIDRDYAPKIKSESLPLSQDTLESIRLFQTFQIAYKRFNGNIYVVVGVSIKTGGLVVVKVSQPEIYSY